MVSPGCVKGGEDNSRLLVSSSFLFLQKSSLSSFSNGFCVISPNDFYGVNLTQWSHFDQVFFFEEVMSPAGISWLEQ